MSKSLAISQRQVTALCKGAGKAGYVAEVKIGGVVVRLIPSTNAQGTGPIDEVISPEAFETLDEYLAWRNKDGAGGA